MTATVSPQVVADWLHLNMLAERGIIPADWPVRVKVIPQELATAASMTENGHRRDMHPAEQIAGFRAMAQEGKTPAQTGDLLGYSPRHVQRMLKLADLAPVILDALAEDPHHHRALSGAGAGRTTPQSSGAGV